MTNPLLPLEFDDSFKIIENYKKSWIPAAKNQVTE